MRATIVDEANRTTPSCAAAWIAATVCLLLLNPLKTHAADGSIGPTDSELLAYWSENYRTPAEYLVEKCRGHKWVFLGEYHRVRHDLELVNAVIPLLHEQTPVRHLAWEFLCVDRTDEANALVTAAQYDRRQAMVFFRSQFPDWPYQEYVAILETIWKSNRQHAAQRDPFKLVGLNPCPDWEVVNFGDDPEAAQRQRNKRDRYDAIMAATLEDQLLSRDLPALVFTGIAHATGKFTEYYVGTDRPLQRMGNLVYKPPYKSAMFFIALHAPFYDSATNKDIYPFDGRLDRLMARFRRDIGFDIPGTPFEHLVHENRSAHSITSYEFGELYDGYIISSVPLKEYVGVTCIPEWIRTDEDLRYFWRHLPNAEAAEEFSKMPLEQFRADFCAPRPDHGVEFKRRFRRLPDIP